MTSEIRLERFDEPGVDAIYDRLVTLYAETHQDLANTGRTVLATLGDGVVSSRTLKVVGTLADGLAPYRSAPAARAFLEQFRTSTRDLTGWWQG